MIFVLAPKIYLFLRGFSSRMGECRGEFFAKKESLCIFHTSRYIAYNIRIRLCASFHSTEADFYIKDYEYNL